MVKYHRISHLSDSNLERTRFSLVTKPMHTVSKSTNAMQRRVKDGCHARCLRRVEKQNAQRSTACVGLQTNQIAGRGLHGRDGQAGGRWGEAHRVEMAPSSTKYARRCQQQPQAHRPSAHQAEAHKQEMAKCKA